MAIIGTLRKYSWVSVVLVAVAIVAFILGDLSKSSRTIPDMGKVNGNTLTPQRFNELVNEAEYNYRQRAQVAQIPSDMEHQIREQVWQDFVNETLMGQETKNLGLKVTAAEMSDMYTGTFIHPYLRQNFTNPQTGQYDLRQVNYIIENFDQLDTAFRMQWIDLEKYVRTDREQQKYNTLIASALYMPKAIAAKIDELGQTTSNVRVASLPMRMVPDEEATISDADFQKYYDNHKAEMRVREEVRELEFITYPVNPTPQDLADIQGEVEKIWAEFQTTSDDEIAFFVNAVSHQRYDSTYRAATSFRAPFDEMVAASAEGAMLAPQVVGNEWMMAKVINSAVRPDSLRASVIYILNASAQGSGVTRSDEDAKHLADSVLALVNSGKMPFEQAVEQFSDDPQKADTKGDMDWQLDGNYGVLNEKLVNTPVGSSFIHEDPNHMGYFVVKVTDKTKPYKKYRVAVITHEIEPSNNTNRSVYNAANMFAGQNRTLAEMEAAAREGNMQVRNAQVNKMAYSVAGISNARDIVQWAFNDETETGSVADKVFECDGQFIVVALKDVYGGKDTPGKYKGYLTPEQARPMIENQVRLEKKAEMLMARANEAMGKGKNIDAVANALGVTVDSVSAVSFASYYFGQFGMEPKVLSALAMAHEGSLVGPVKGASGVYVIQVDNQDKTEAQADHSATQRRMEQAYGNKVRALTQALRDNAKIKDQRNKHF